MTGSGTMCCLLVAGGFLICLYTNCQLVNTHDVIIMSQYSVEVVAHGQVVWFGCQIWHNVYYFMYIMYIIVYTTQSVYTTLYTSAVPIQTCTTSETRIWSWPGRFIVSHYNGRKILFATFWVHFGFKGTKPLPPSLHYSCTLVEQDVGWEFDCLTFTFLRILMPSLHLFTFLLLLFSCECYILGFGYMKI